jgi:exodeoxyribonuclease VII large subunit
VARLETSAESPVPVRVVAIRIGEWISRLGEIWVDGQVAQLNRRPGVATQFLTLRDPDANVSMTVTCGRGVLPDSVSEGSRVVLRARPDFYLERGTLSLRATEIRPVGLGELLARLEELRRLLAAEGLFAPERKRPLPFLPRIIGLITGRAGAAERDVVENARRRLPGARFRLENVAMQGVNAVPEVVDALRRLDRDPEVDVIVIARGGGSVEDLLPFSNETLVRAVSEAFTPVVSAIGHETDRPLLDLVADLAASTPTDAAKRIVPDLAEELRGIAELRARSRSCIRARVERETELMHGLPERLRRTVRTRLERDHADTGALRARARQRISGRLETARSDLEHVRARVRTLSPQATLDRGYAVVRTEDGVVVRAPAEALGPLRIRVAGGEFGAAATGDR